MTLTSFTCRSCGHADLHPVLSLGRMPLANSLLAPEDLARPEPIYLLDLVFCPLCTLVQITETLAPEALFQEYLYFSSFSDTMLRHAQTLVSRAIASRGLNQQSLVVEVGSNDGYLLQYFAASGIPVLGIEPAANVAAVAVSRGIPTMAEFFGRDLAGGLQAQGLAADVLIANNVLAHVADLNGFVSGVARLLRDGGIAYIEVPYVKDMIDRCEFDTIYHEHLCYFSLTALQRLFHRYHLMIADVERLPVHGGSLRLHVVHADRVPAGDAIERMLDQEAAWGVDRLEAYGSFGRRAQQIKTALVDLLVSLRQADKRLAGYGAAAKATVLLNYCGIGPALLEFVADLSPHKQGRFIPGVRLPVVPPERLMQDRPDYTLLLAWNLADEVLRQQADYRRAGGLFIVPIPDVTIV